MSWQGFLKDERDSFSSARLGLGLVLGWIMYMVTSEALGRWQLTDGAYSVFLALISALAAGAYAPKALGALRKGLARVTSPAPPPPDLTREVANEYQDAPPGGDS